jgi:hypothetical protein
MRFKRLLRPLNLVTSKMRFKRLLRPVNKVAGKTRFVTICDQNKVASKKRFCACCNRLIRSQASKNLFLYFKQQKQQLNLKVLEKQVKEGKKTRKQLTLVTFFFFCVFCKESLLPNFFKRFSKLSSYGKARQNSTSEVLTRSPSSSSSKEGSKEEGTQCKKKKCITVLRANHFFWYL